ncbi:MAG: hypothetical protein ACPG5P_05975 [Saprospiraceae bacterium]
MPKTQLPFVKDYKQGLYGLLLVFSLLFIVSFLVSWRPTFQAWKGSQKYKERLRVSQGAMNRIPILEKQLKEWESLSIHEYDRDLLIEKLSRFCKENDLLIRDFPSTDKDEQGGVLFYTNRIEVEGQFKDITRLIYMLEHRERLGTVVSTDFQKGKDRITKKNYLRGIITLRNIKS